MDQSAAQVQATDVAQEVVSGRPLYEYLKGTTDQTDVAAHRLAAHVGSVKGLLARLEPLVVPEHLATVSDLAQRMDSFSAEVALIGQVKAGKTRLTGALAGLPGVLPSDVNPWTSVVTAIHINTPSPRGSDAVFNFYTPEEWAGLTEGGGRLGELARRAGFEDELTEMQAQVRQMQVRTELRLGANFGLLLGSQHKFNGFNRALLEKYVCLGDETLPAEANGRYADVTRSADLYLTSEEFGLPLTLSDTPGVNDPFLAREIATLNTLSRTDVCIIVLSAHQAFSTVDLALMRVLMALETDQIVLFVNRVDELEDPDRQIREIDGFIRGILAEKGLSPRIPIVYGSAAWADVALRGEAARARPQAIDRLRSLAEARVARATTTPSEGRMLLGQPPYSLNKLRDLSGLHEPKGLVTRKTVMNVSAPFAAEVLVLAQDVANQSALLLSGVLEGDLPLKAGLDASAMLHRLDASAAGLRNSFPRVAQSIIDRMLMQMSATYRDFIVTESGRLRDMLVSGGRTANWSPDTEALRRSLNSAYHAFVAETNREIGEFYANAAAVLSGIYADVLEDEKQLFAVRAPRVVDPKAPALLMRTMSFDMKTTWIGSWLARATGPDAMVKRFTDAVTSEMVDFLKELQDVHVRAHVGKAQQILNDFLAAHVETLRNLVAQDDVNRESAARQKLEIEIDLRQRLVSLKGLVTELQAQIDALSSDFRLTAR